MIYQLIVNGQNCDLPSNFKLTMKYESPNLLMINHSFEQDRSNTFALPITATNREIFKVIHSPNALNDNLNKSFTATLIIGTNSISGKLYIDNVTATAYNCVFINNQKYPRLATMGLSKKINTMYFTDSVVVGQNIKYANAITEGTIFENIRYQSKYSNTPLPAINLKQLLYRFLTENGIANQWNTQPLTNGELWAIIPKGNMLPTIPGKFQRKITGGYVDTTAPMLPKTINTNILTADNEDISMYLTETEREIFYDEQTITNGVAKVTRKKSRLRTFVANIDIVLGFEENFPDTWFVGSIDGDGLSQSASSFYGGYEFAYTNGTYVTSGTPLAGRKIEIPKNQPFCLLYRNDYSYAPTPFTPGTSQRRGWTIGATSDNFTITIEAKESKAEVGDTIRLQDNLPDISVLDLYLTICACEGLTASIVGDTLAINPPHDNVPSFDFGENLISYEVVENKVYKFGIKNWLKTKHEKWTDKSEYVDVFLESKNKNLEDDFTIYELPFADGGKGGNPSGQQCIELRNAIGEDCENFIITKATNNNGYLQRIEFSTIPEELALPLAENANREFNVKIRTGSLNIDEVIKYLLNTIGNNRIIIKTIEDNNGILIIQSQIA